MEKVSEKKDLLFEIGTEELPSICIEEGIADLRASLSEKLGDEHIGFEDVKVFGTPRRLAAIVYGLKTVQDSVEKLITGPPYRIAFDDKGAPTKAAKGFANSNKVKIEELEKVSTDKGEYLGFKDLMEGKDTIEILPSILVDTLKSISFSMQMTWSDLTFKFARPIRWIYTVYGEENISLVFENIPSPGHTRGHRTLGSDVIKIVNPKDYEEAMETEGRVIVDPAKRKEMILSGIKVLESKKADFKVLMDEGLLKEVVNLVEIPNVLVGSFPSDYLSIPKEILIKAIQHHQRYFAVLGSKDDVRDEFVFVQNGLRDPEGEIVKGNERVLKARLSDASYFYNEDNKKGFDEWFEKLSGLVFYSGLGNMQEKSKRLAALGEKFIKMINAKDKDAADNSEALFKRAAYICKCDLVTNMVVEFPGLQGTVGKEYAKGKKENTEVAQAVFEHYLPRSANDILPQTSTGAMLSIIDKLDTITGMFLLDNIPTGSQDPFALRRKASGIVQITLDHKYDFELSKIIRTSIDEYIDRIQDLKPSSPGLSERVLSFIVARHRFMLEKKDMRLDIFDSVAATDCTSLLKLKERFDALLRFFKTDKPELLSLPMTRCKNIVKGNQIKGVDKDLFRQEEESELYKAIKHRSISISSLESDYKYDDILKELKGFGPIVDRFFDEVLVMDKDLKIRQNRVDLVNEAMGLYLRFADFSKLVI